MPGYGPGDGYGGMDGFGNSKGSPGKGGGADAGTPGGGFGMGVGPDGVGAAPGGKGDTGLGGSGTLGSKSGTVKSKSGVVKTPVSFKNRLGQIQRQAAKKRAEAAAKAKADAAKKAKADAERTKQINEITEQYGLVTQDQNLSSYNKSLGLGLKDLSNMSFENRQAYSQSLTDAFNEATQAQTTKQSLDSSAVNKSQEGETAAQRLSGILAAVKDNVTFDNMYSSLGKFAQATNPTANAITFGLNLANFNPQFEGDVTTASSRFGPLGTALFGSYNLNSPAYGFTEAQKQSFANALYSPDFDNPDVFGTPGYTVDADAAKAYADSIAPGVFDSLSLENTAREVAASVGGNKGGGTDPIVTNTGTGSGGDDGGDDDTGSGKTYTEAEERTMRYLAEMGYDRGYAEDYIDQGGTLFNFDIYDDTDFVSDYINT